MATSLSEIRKNKSALLKKVNAAMSGADKSDKTEDDRFWKITRDATGNGSAIIRFLPPCQGDELPWVKVFSRSFKNPTTGKYYINEDPSTIGRDDDPVWAYTKTLYATGLESDKKIASPMKRKTQYISNILVIKDPANPANDGKVFFFKYGESIHGMIKAKANPEFEDDVKFEAWDIDEGANFRIRIRQDGDYATYDRSVFDSQTPLCGGDEEAMIQVINQYRPVAEFLDPKRFKSGAQLKAEFDRVMGFGPAIGKASDLVNTPKQEDPGLGDIPDSVTIPDKKPKVTKPKAEVKQEETPPWDESSATGGDDDEEMALFKAMLGKK